MNVLEGSKMTVRPSLGSWQPSGEAGSKLLQGTGAQPNREEESEGERMRHSPGEAWAPGKLGVIP